MGQNASSPRQQEVRVHHDHRVGLDSQLGRPDGSRTTRWPRMPTLNRNQGYDQQPTPDDSSSSINNLATFSRQVSAQSTLAVRDGQQHNTSPHAGNQILYEHHEERPLRNVEELGMRDAPITDITASPMPRRSRLSTLRSILVPRFAYRHGVAQSNRDHRQSYVIGNFVSEGELQPQTRLISRSHSRRHSLLDSILHRTGGEERHRETRVISGPFPSALNSALSPINHTPSTGEILPPYASDQIHPSASNRATFSPPAPRFRRRRQSISAPFNPRNVPHIPRRPLSSITAHEAYSSIGGTELRPWQTNSTNQTSNSIPRRSLFESGRDIVSPIMQQPSILEGNPGRLSEHHMNGRNTHEAGQGSETPLSEAGSQEQNNSMSRMLSLAALTIASRLSGNPDQMPEDLETVDGNNLEGSLQNLFRILQSSSPEAEEPQAGQTRGDAPNPSNAPSPLNFLRVFRVANSRPSLGRPLQTSGSASPTGILESTNPVRQLDLTDEQVDNRTVTLVVVGVRSINPGDALQENRTQIAHSARSLFGLSSRNALNPLSQHRANGLMRRASARTRLPHRRRSSSGGIDLQASQALYESDPPSPNAEPNPQLLEDPVFASSRSQATIPLALAESPPGPYPPPSTPANAGLSSHSSGATTPTRRPPSMSMADPAAFLSPRIPPLASDQPTSSVRYRRRSDSEFARHRDLGAGAARRNGMVGLEDAETGIPPTSANRSWLIYVVGASLSEDHPALSAPSLFSDVSQVPLLRWSNYAE